MKRAEALLAIGMAIALSGCSLHKQPPVKAAAPAPAPVAAPAPAPPPEPLSIPQTTVELPPPQPLTPEALATTQPPGEPTPPPPPPSRPQRSPSRGTPARTEPPAPAPAPVAPATPTEPDRQPIIDLLSPTELKKLQDEFEQHRQEVRKLVEQAGANLNTQQRATVDRINSFLKQAEEAEQRKDMRQASELAARALVLAKELK